jgi:hypothetical protein
MLCDRLRDAGAIIRGRSRVARLCPPRQAHRMPSATDRFLCNANKAIDRSRSQEFLMSGFFFALFILRDVVQRQNSGLQSRVCGFDSCRPCVPHSRLDN